MKAPALTPAQARELVALHRTGKEPRPLTSRKLRQLDLIDPDGWQLTKTGRQEAERLAKTGESS